MNIELKKITVEELAEDYEDKSYEGVLGYGGKLDIRPPYQREFIYKANQRNAVIDTLSRGFPLNVMYWAVNDKDSFEIIDGQQRTISICQYVKGDFSVDSKYFHNLQNDEQKKILDYELMIYLCSGTDSEKLKWFETINIAGAILTPQELRNAVYAGSWLSDAKRYFSKNDCAAKNLASDYMSGIAIRQEYLEAAIKWISNNDINEYMATHQDDETANELWEHFQAVINWVKTTFTVTRKQIMKNVDWGALHQYKNKQLDPDETEEKIKKLLLDDDVTKKSGIYPYILTEDEKHLSIRTFADGMKHKVYEKQKGICVICKKHFELSEMEADHITPWHEGGKTIEENCQMLCKDCNRRKSGK